LRLPLTLTLSPFAPKWRDGERESGQCRYSMLPGAGPEWRAYRS